MSGPFQPHPFPALIAPTHLCFSTNKSFMFSNRGNWCRENADMTAWVTKWECLQGRGRVFDIHHPVECNSAQVLEAQATNSYYSVKQKTERHVRWVLKHRLLALTSNLRVGNCGAAAERTMALFLKDETSWLVWFNKVPLRRTQMVN